MSGTLYLVATPHRQSGGSVPRGVQTLQEADFIAAEDTRVSMKLLNHFDIRKPLVSYHEHNRAAAGPLPGRLLAGGDCALVTDAGTPAISDPGEDLVRLCGGKRRHGAGHPRLLRRRVRPGGVGPAHRAVHL